jgi:ABC-type multidrug transport system ATPase subunit/ABC-type multidrug transport system permease subunit
MLSETTASFMGRPILSRHRRFGYYRPAAHSIAAVLVDIPVVLAQVTIFSIVYYFMCHFQFTASKFFTHWIILCVISLCFSSEYRAIGALFTHFGNASKISGTITMIMMIYAGLFPSPLLTFNVLIQSFTGYLIPFGSMHVWFRWIHWINPASYAFESLMANEWSGLKLSCENPQYIPYGSGYTDSNYRACTVVGSSGSTIDGNSYIAQQYAFSHNHVWRGFGIVVAFWIFFACLTAVGFELIDSADGSARVLFKRGSKPQTADVADDEEKTGRSVQQASSSNSAVKELHESAQQATFTWKDLNYFVNVRGHDKQLLRNVSGFAKPGQLVALMGTSGAGKTTLMDVLAQRKDSGRIEGIILIDGAPQGITFQRTTGYCEQMDVHEPTATVRESLLFSARLRQEHTISDREKKAYVDQIIDLLDLSDIEDALVGEPGAGLNVEQRKRLTIGVELVAKPSLLFLDEPTSGLDGQSAFAIVRFMRKLADNGQAIVCTIHQPSAALFNSFDSLLLLAKGGQTTYFGKIGEHSAEVLNYFAKNGAPCDVDANPAEYVIDVVQNDDGSGKDWTQIWEGSNERQQMMEELDRLNKEAVAASHPHVDDHADGRDNNFATPIPYQIRLVTRRQIVALWRSPDYVWNKIFMHIMQALFAGFTFWMIGDSQFDLQLRLFAVFNFVFIAPGMINQLQPLFLRNRDVFETREKKVCVLTETCSNSGY